VHPDRTIVGTLLQLFVIAAGIILIVATVYATISVLAQVLPFLCRNEFVKSFCSTAGSLVHLQLSIVGMVSCFVVVRKVWLNASEIREWFVELKEI